MPQTSGSLPRPNNESKSKPSFENPAVREVVKKVSTQGMPVSRLSHELVSDGKKSDRSAVLKIDGQDDQRAEFDFL